MPKSPLTNPAQWWNKIIFRQVNKGEKKKQILYMLERIDWINVTLPQALPETASKWRLEVGKSRFNCSRLAE